MLEQIITIINIIRKNKGLPSSGKFTEKTNLMEDIGFDSFDLAELTVRIEEKFNVDIFENGIVNTLGEVLEIIKINQKQS